MASKRPAAAPRKGPPERKALPRPGDPLVTKEGQVVQPDRVGDDDPRPLDVAPGDFRAFHRQDLDDIPAEPKLINACAVVLMYTMLGISDREIMLELKLRDDQLEKIRQEEVYAIMFKACSNELINVNSMSLQSRIAGMAHGALTNVFEIAKFGKKEETKLAANKDILDRAGTKVGDQAERTKGTPVGLRIVVTKGDEAVIDVQNVNMGV